MTKAFFEVFPMLHIDEALGDVLVEAKVERVVFSGQDHCIHIHVTLGAILDPVQIKAIEAKIAEHLSADGIKSVKIHERYQLKYPMDFSALYSFYTRALVDQIKEEDPICAYKLLKTEPDIKAHHVTYTLSDQLYRYFNEKNIDRKIETIFKDKFDLSLSVNFKKASGEALIEAFLENRRQEEAIAIKEMDAKNRLAMVDAKPVKKVIQKKDVEGVSHQDVILGKRPILGEVTLIESFDGATSDVIVDAIILNYDERQTKSKRLILLDVYDLTEAITCKAFINEDVYDKQVRGALKSGMSVRLKGRLQFDTFTKENTIFLNGIQVIDAIETKKEDALPDKRIELHAHTQMSDMDAVVSAKDLVNRALHYGHEAIAITDHGVVQAFPDAFHAAEGKPIKIIYGVEGYLIDDEVTAVTHLKGQHFQDTFVVFDIETTGLRAGIDCLTEIGAVKIREGKIVGEFSSFVNPERPIPYAIQEMTHITPDMVKDAPTYESVLVEFLEFAGDAVLVAHNADFDMGFIQHFSRVLHLEVPNTVVDTLTMARVLYPNLARHRLNNLAKHLSVKLAQHHRAIYDAMATTEIFIKMIADLNDRNIHTLDQYKHYEQNGHLNLNKLRSNHIILLAQNLTGLRNLYELISDAHMKYYHALKPRMPKSEIKRLREGILIGSACESGELYQAILLGKGIEEIESIAALYDFYEIQPIANNLFLVRDGKVASEADLIEINKQIIALGKKHNKPVVATGDVHFLDPKDEVYRRILMAGKGFSDADQQAPLYLRTTQEMLDTCYYLDHETAMDVVVRGPKQIADAIEKIDPVPPDKYPPEIEGSDETLRTLCYEQAHEIYGPVLPEPVEQRLERELKSIIDNGFAVMYIIAQKLVHKSNEDGYLVGSRGSVGSSLAATMSGITEVNPLPAHYVCPKCYYVDFDSETVKAHSGNSGCDLPDQACPKCHTLLNKEGHDIPFETFLGFYGDKEPDIDLNFSGAYQAKAHAYTEELFGEGHVFRAGTIGTLAEKTAFGFVKKYFDERGVEVTKASMNRLVRGCTGVRRTTGQHPGGIIVVPKDQSIFKFTPIQRPANDMNSTITTTHFDYHSIDHNLLKLDILGHDDPTIIKMLEDLTGVDAKTIPLDEPKVMSLFSNLSALGIAPSSIDGCELGCLGVPEFGTDFVIQMLQDTKPKQFSDLVRISGLSHGTDVWLGNAQTLIKEGKADITEIISTRDDIMIYLIHKGLEAGLAFTIMESVRKGKGLKPDWEQAMRDNQVPEWYIWSCNKIKYMFPKAHAVAYVMMAYRIAYFKVYNPLAYYAVFFSIRATGFNYELMCHGKDHLDRHMQQFKERMKTEELTNKDKDTLKDMKVVQEMYARGFEFMPIDLYQVDATNFLIFDGKIMPALSAIQGLGEKAAKSLVVARANGPFLSVEDLMKRSKLSKTVIEELKKNRIIKDLQETNQVDLFSWLD